MRTRCLRLGLLALLFASFPALAQGQRREVKWNNPEGTGIAGIEHRSFQSPSMGVEVGYNVALPPGYGEGTARYPVIYFLHGAGGNENSDAGGFSGLVNRMVAAGKLPPVLCVFPNGGMSGYRDNPERKVMGETLVVKELVPLIDRTYRTRANRESRLLCGFSMGGGGAVRLALKHPDLFSAAASWAGALSSRRGEPAPELQVEHLRRTAGKVRLLLIVGDQDFLYESHKSFVRSLEEAKYPAATRVLEGVGHNLGLYHQKTGDELVTFLGSGLK